MIGEGSEDRRELLDDLAQAREAVEARAAVEYLEDPFLSCHYGHHAYRYIGAESYRCEDCGSTDPEGDSAR